MRPPHSGPGYLVEWDLPTSPDMATYPTRNASTSPLYTQIPEVCRDEGSGRLGRPHDGAVHAVGQLMGALDRDVAEPRGGQPDAILAL